MSPSKREREYARRRYEKRAAKAAKAAKLQRERRIVATVVVLTLVLVGGALFLLNRNAETPTEAGTTPPVTQTPPADPDALPTTNPQMFDAPPPAADSLNTEWTVQVATNVGDLTLTLDGAAAPQAVSSFLMLASNGFFDGTACHRLLPDSLLQCGDPTATGTGGPGYSFGPIENAPADDLYPAGTVAMARQGGNDESMGSQFFLVFDDVTLPSDAAGGYTVFGEITAGLDVLQAVGATGTADGGPDGRPAENVILESVEVVQ